MIGSCFLPAGAGNPVGWEFGFVDFVRILLTDQWQVPTLW
jgi:hypothetical protein